MNRFVKTALAIVAAGSAANAGTGDNDWLALDSEISGLASSLKPSQDGMSWSALIRAVYSHSSDDIATGVGGSDTSGFNFNDVDIAFWGNQGGYKWRISADIEDNDAGLATSSTDLSLVFEDAYVGWNCGGYFDAMMGQFKPHFSRSNSVDPEYLVMIDRSSLGSALDVFDDGIGASGNWEQQLAWYVAMTDGQNGHEADHLYLVRGEWMLGTGAGEIEGARGSSDTLNATAGVSMIHDDSNGDFDGDGDHDNTSFIGDFYGSVSNFGFGFEIALLDDDTFLITDEDYSNIVDAGLETDIGSPFDSLSGILLTGDSMPWSLTASYLVSEELEVAGRYEDLDNDDNGGPDNTILVLGVNWYKDSGKWQANISNIDADSSFNDGTIIELGYAIGVTR